jgi:hypothetical protein
MSRTIPAAGVGNGWGNEGNVQATTGNNGQRAKIPWNGTGITASMHQGSGTADGQLLGQMEEEKLRPYFPLRSSIG